MIVVPAVPARLEMPAVVLWVLLPIAASGRDPDGSPASSDHPAEVHGSCTSTLPATVRV
jgi:hypothetical protein